MKKTERIARAANWEILFLDRRGINSRMIMVDLDGVKRYDRAFGDFCRAFYRVVSELWPKSKWKMDFSVSPSGEGYHFWAWCISKKSLNPYKVLLAQCLIGSDIGRERMNLARLTSKIENWNRLFSTKRKKLY